MNERLPKLSSKRGGWPVLDMHTHLAGLGQGGTRCFIAPGTYASPLFKVLRHSLGIFHSHKRREMDQAYLSRLRRHLGEAVNAGDIDGIVVFAHDRIHLSDGTPDPARQELFVPNSHAFRVCEEHRERGRMLPAMSVHPYRPDALPRAEFWISRGAVAMKWLPNSMNIDPLDTRTREMCKLLALRGIPLIVHTGGEHTATVIEERFGNPDLFIPALEEGLTVIFAHCGTRSGFSDPDWLPNFRRLARDYPSAWGDISAICSVGRTRWISSLLEDPAVSSKLVHGSDFPIPPLAWPGAHRIGLSRCLALQKVWSFLSRDVRIKKEWGVPPEVFTNGARLIGRPRLEEWGWTIKGG